MAVQSKCAPSERRQVSTVRSRVLPVCDNDSLHFVHYVIIRARREKICIRGLRTTKGQTSLHIRAV